MTPSMKHVCYCVGVYSFNWKKNEASAVKFNQKKPHQLLISFMWVGLLPHKIPKSFVQHEREYTSTQAEYCYELQAY